MTKTDLMDKPITLRQLLGARDALVSERSPVSMRRIIARLEDDATRPKQTDLIKAGPLNLLCRVVNQPARRVQVGDLVTMESTGLGDPPRVVRVHVVDVPAPTDGPLRRAVAISPDDAARIKDAIGEV